MPMDKDRIAQLEEALARFEERANATSEALARAEERANAAQKAKELAEKAKELAEREKERAEREKERAKKEKERAEKEKEQAEKEKEQAEKEKERAEKEKERAEEDKERAEEDKERAEKAKDLAEARQAPSRFLEYIQHAEEELYSVFYKESDKDKLSSGGINAPNGKYYPLRLRHWEDFGSEHARLFGTLDEVFTDKALFPSLTDVQGVRRDLSPDGAADELDIRAFIRSSIEKPAARIVEQYLQLRPHGSIQRIAFKNNAYGLLFDQDTPVTPSESDPSPKRASPTKRIGVPDRWGHACHDDESETRTLIFVGEYKAAHKLTPRLLRNVLSTPPREAFFTELLKTEREISSTTGASTRINPSLPGAKSVAYVLCQAFHYMITSGLEFGYIASGDGLIFLRVLDHDPQTLYYFLALFPIPPMQDHDARRLAIRGMRIPRDTAVAYLCSFCLQTIASKVRPSDWISDAEACLVQWPIPYEGLLGNYALRLSRVGLLGRDDDNDDAEDGGGAGKSRQHIPPSDTTGRNSQKHSRSDSQTQSSSVGTGLGQQRTLVMDRYVVEPPTRPYCTQACLLGLVRGLPFDKKCPNVQFHRAAAGDNYCHRIDIGQLHSQLVSQLDKHLEKDCECLDKYGLFGRFGVLFKITLSTSGYTFVAKGVQTAHHAILEREAAIYQTLEAFQGQLLPVFLGVIHLSRPFPLHSCARISHMMLLGWAGPDLVHHVKLPRDVDLELEIQKTTDELEGLGLRNDDVREANLTWNDEARRVMYIDFDQAYFVRWQVEPSDSPLQSLQSSQKRRFADTLEEKKEAHIEGVSGDNYYKLQRLK